jgi:hypothetical protein
LHSTGVGDRNWEYYTSASANVKVPETPAFGGLIPQVGGWQTTVGSDLGHGRLGHSPDWTWSDKAKSMKMAEEVFKELKEFAKCCGGCKADEWETIKPTVQKFLDYEAKTTLQRMKFWKIPALHLNATFKGYNEKIKLLDDSFEFDKMYEQDYGN